MRQSWPRLVLIGTLSCSIPIAAGADDRTSGTDHPVEHESPLSAIGPRFSAGLTTFEASHDDRAVGVEARASKGYSLGVYAAWWRTGWLERCLASTLEGAVWHSGIDEVSSRRTMEVWFPYGLIRDVVRDIRPRRGR